MGNDVVQEKIVQQKIVKKSFQYIDEVQCKGENLYKVQQQDRRDNPYMMGIGALTFKRQGMATLGKGTAFLISPDLALTNAHNIFDKKTSLYHSNLKLYPGLQGKLQNEVQIESYELPIEYTKKEESQYQYDYALLKLKRKPSNIKSENTLTIGMNFKDVNATLGIFGYPGFGYETANINGTEFTANLYGLLKEKRIREIRQLNLLIYEISTFSGQSGSPIVTMINKKPVAIGIHSGGSSQNNVNAGRLISPDMIDNLSKWAAKMKGSPFEDVNLGVDLKKFIINNWKKDTPYFNHFQVNGNTLKRIPVNNEEAFSYYQVVSQNLLPLKGNHQMTFKIVKYGENFSFITLGLIAASRRSEQDSGGEGASHQDSIGYQTGAYKYGSIFIDGKSLANFDEQIYIPEGQDLKMEIDRAQNIIKFTNTANFKNITLVLPESFKNKEILPFISMSDPGDCVEIVQ